VFGKSTLIVAVQELNVNVIMLVHASGSFFVCGENPVLFLMLIDCSYLLHSSSVKQMLHSVSDVTSSDKSK